MMTKELLNALKAFVNSRLLKYSPAVSESEAVYSPYISEYRNVTEFIHQKKKPSFANILFSFIDRKGTSDTEIYKRAGIDRRHFSKIRSNPEYKPGKSTIISLALSLELNKEDTLSLLNSVGYTLSQSEISDLVILFCLEKKIYDICDINMALDYFNLKPMGGALE